NAAQGGQPHRVVVAGRPVRHFCVWDAGQYPRIETTLEISLMSNKVVNSLSIALGAALFGTVMVANAANPFSLNDLGQGYQVADKAKEGKCGEGKCGATKGKKCMDMAAKADQDKCLADKHCGADFK